MQDVQLDMPDLELAMQELEPMEAPGFWSGFMKSVAVTAASVGAASASAAVSALVTT